MNALLKMYKIDIKTLQDAYDQVHITSMKALILGKSLLLPAIIFMFSSTLLKAQSSTYIVLTTTSDTTDAYYQAAVALGNYRNAQLIQMDPGNINQLLPTLISINPRYVAVVCKPVELHINFIRQFLMMSTKLDIDPFSDFSYGFITGATGQDALQFVNNIIYAETQHIQDYPLNVGGYAATSLNYVYTGTDGYMTYLNPPSSSCIWLETNDSGSGRDFFLTNANYMSNNKLLDIGHNGDPHMLWLFEGGNINPNPPVWNYDSTRIEDPAYARAGLSSYDIGNLSLYPAVAFNGACHSGEPKQVMVEGDIAATFGDTQGQVRFYIMSDTFSFALSILRTGITGYFAPCGANNANDQGEDVYNAFLYHEPLGDIQKRSNDAVVMGFLGNRPNLRTYVEGGSTYNSDILVSGTFDPADWPGASSMLGGKANRIYFGDPLFNPYQNNHSDSLNITRASVDSIDASTLHINVTFWPVWDKFHYGDTRIYIPVELPWYCGNLTSFSVLGSSGPYNLVIQAIEHFAGKTILHIEVDIPNDMYSVIDYSIQFRITFINTGAEELQQAFPQILVYPNPAKNSITLEFSNPEKKKHTLFIYNAEGQVVSRNDNIDTDVFRVDHTGLGCGLYFFRLQNEKGMAGSGKFVIK
ncbi:MAG: T9SS type A sorting domain-containing protein [Bacteroidetes bacterium]|nr:T9SS type A sorting domain-containing protein [Bacteroidota bacterium]